MGDFSEKNMTGKGKENTIVNGMKFPSLYPRTRNANYLISKSKPMTTKLRVTRMV